MGGRDQGPKYFIGLAWSEKVKSAKASSRSRCRRRATPGWCLSGDPHALDIASRDAAAGASDGPVCRLDFRSVGAGAQGRRLLLQSRGDLLAASVAPRSGVAKSRRTTNRPAAHFRCVRRCGRTQSAPRSSSWSASRATRFWCAASIASTKRRWWTSSRTAASSRRWRRRKPGDFETGVIRSFIVRAKRSNPSHQAKMDRFVAEPVIGRAFARPVGSSQ